MTCQNLFKLEMKIGISYVDQSESDSLNIKKKKKKKKILRFLIL